MLLIIEIIMTVAAFRRGFKGWALLPIGFAFLTGALIGMNNPELALSDQIFNYVWIDIIAIVVLGIMIVAGKNKVEKSENLNTSGNIEELPEH